MAFNDHGRNDAHNDPPADQPIPLQDLSRPSETDADDSRGRKRLSGARRSLFLPKRQSGTIYQRITGDSSPDAFANREAPSHQPPANDPDGNDSDTPVAEDLSGFAQATPSFGLDFGTPEKSRSPIGSRASYENSDGGLDNVPLSPFVPEQNDQFLSPSEYYMSSVDVNEDTTHLTDPAHLQPIGGRARSQSNQSSARTVHFGDHASETGSRLGDDLPQLEAGLGQGHRGSGSHPRTSRSHSPSPSRTALGRASSMMKSMSQRVVNLSNEPEVIEHSIQKEESLKNSRQENSRLDEPPDIPAMDSHAHDSRPPLDSSSDREAREKKPDYGEWKYGNNPLRGRALGILGPDNPIRTTLCDILVHPFTEPFILLIIIIQAILVTIQTSTVYDWSNRHPGKKTHLISTEYALLVIFVIYSLETVARILVSGFIFNPPEYSTLDRSLSWRKAAVQRSKNILQPQRRLSVRKAPSATELPQVSIIRTFTGLNQQEEHVVDERQKQRIRLAHRAFLRHSFNRLDFVAIVAFWVYFFLSLEGVEINRLFHMLSCLRILRLLSITNGTSVS